MTDPVVVEAIWLNLGVTAVAALILVTITFAVGRALGTFHVIDGVWGLGFAVLAGISFGLSADHGSLPIRLTLTVLTWIWGLRLAGHILRRNRGKPEDARYQEILERGDRPLLRMYTRVYLVQAAVLWFVSLPLQVGQYGGDGLGVLAWVGMLVWAVGMVFETVGDAQLAAFKADPANRGKVMDRGLWAYTRHPNYFGDASVWWGLFLVAAHDWPVLLTIGSPVLMTWLVARGSGKPILERQMARRYPEYADYVARTSGFVPRPPARRRD